MTDSPIDPANFAPEISAAPVEAPRETPLLKAAAKRQAKLADLLNTAAAAQGLDDPEMVHDLRVAARRLSEVLRLIEQFLDKPTAKAVGGSLRSLRQTMGDLRDSDVMRDHLAKWRMPAAIHKHASELAEQLGQGRAALAEAAAQQVRSTSLQGSMVLIAHLLEEQSKGDNAAVAEEKIAAELRRLRKRREKQMRAAFGEAARRQTPDVLHAARITAKKLRYATELADAGNGERGLKKQLKFLKGVQELLGDHHDAHVIENMLDIHLRGAAGRSSDSDHHSLAAAWKKWRRENHQLQAKRAAIFFMRSYAWMNTP